MRVSLVSLIVFTACVAPMFPQKPPEPAKKPEYGIDVRKVSEMERIVAVQGDILNVSIKTGKYKKREYLFVYVEQSDQWFGAGVETTCLRKVTIQGVVFTDITVGDDGKSFRDALGYTYELVNGPELRGNGPLKGVMEWQRNGELTFREPTVGNLNVTRVWKRSS